MKSSSVRCLEVVVDKGSSPFVLCLDDNVDIKPVENLFLRRSVAIGYC